MNGIAKFLNLAIQHGKFLNFSSMIAKILGHQGVSKFFLKKKSNPFISKLKLLP